MLAVCLASHSKGKTLVVSKEKLNPLVRRHFPEWADEWEQYAEMLP